MKGWCCEFLLACWMCICVRSSSLSLTCPFTTNRMWGPLLESCVVCDSNIADLCRPWKGHILSVLVPYIFLELCFGVVFECTFVTRHSVFNWQILIFLLHYISYLAASFPFNWAFRRRILLPCSRRWHRSLLEGNTHSSLFSKHSMHIPSHGPCSSAQPVFPSRTSQDQLSSPRHSHITLPPSSPLLA